MRQLLDKRPVVINVQWRGKERVVRLWTHQGQWHGELEIPGVEELFGHVYQPAPKGAELPMFEVDRNNELRIEAPKKTAVMQMGMAALIELGDIKPRNGWLEIQCCFFSWPGRDHLEFEESRGYKPPQAEILSFPSHGGREGR